MQTRRDQFQAYKYVLRRVLTSMIGNDPEAPEQPLRRVASASGISIVFGALACGGVGIYGWLVGSSSDDWTKEAGQVVREEASGAQFVHVKNAKTGELELRPVPNYTSARLILGQPDPEVLSLSKGSFEGVPKGGAIGIPGAPAPVPAVEDLTSSPIAVCSRPHREADDGGKGHQTDVVVGDDDIGEDMLDQRVLVVQSDGPDEQLYLLYKGKRLAATQEAISGLDIQEQPIVISHTVLNAIPAGDPLAVRLPDTVGSAGPTVEGTETVVGQVFQTPGENGDYYLMLDDGTRPLTEVQARLLLSPGGGAVQPGGVEQVTPDRAPASVLSGMRNGRTITTGDLPSEMPTTADLATDASATTATVCAWYEGEDGTPALSVNGEVPDASGASASSSAASEGGSTTADHTIVRPSTGAVVGMTPQKGTRPSVYFLITDTGTRYQMKQDVLGTLGYSGEDFGTPPTYPSSVLRLIPEGPTLSKEAALQPVEK